MIDDPVHEAVHRAIAEDLGEETDITTDATVPADMRGRALLVVREDAILAGCEPFEYSFQEFDNNATVHWNAKEGERIHAGETVATVEATLRAILTGERTALNFLQSLSGIATVTRRFVDAAGGIAIRDTRKTTPGMRTLEKAAVRAGGGVNHRYGLYDAYLIKDNHIVAAGGVRPAIERARAERPGLWIEIECETLDQVREALDGAADEILLDNMDVATLREAVALARGKAKTEASGGVSLETVGAIAATGVDSISVGALTHSAGSVDFSLEVDADAARR